MSYVRWSSVWPDPFDTIQEKIDSCYRDGEYQGWEEVLRAAQSCNPECEISDWYIFWHCGASDDPSQETRKDQLLAMWQAGHDHTPVLPYDTVRYMYQKDHWEMLGYDDLTQKDLLRHCVARWLCDVEEEYHE